MMDYIHVISVIIHLSLEPLYSIKYLIRNTIRAYKETILNTIVKTVVFVPFVLFQMLFFVSTFNAKE